MKITLTALSFIVFMLFLANCHTTQKPANTSVPSAEAAPDPHAEEIAKFSAQLRREIAGREKEPVETVFQNLKVLKGFPAERLISAMENWSEALGVSCDYCHVKNEWHQDAVAEKDISRQMVKMGERINAELRTMKGLEYHSASINCYSCHRGETKPARKAGGDD